MPATLTSWRPYLQKTDSSSNLGEGRFLSAACTMIAAGPPRLSAVGGVATASASLTTGATNFALPIGLVQNLNIGSNRGLSRFFEIGSDRSYAIMGRTTHQIGFGRVLYHGPSLLRCLYAFYQDSLAPTVIQSFGVDGVNLNVLNRHDVKIPPGYENLWLNLASDIFMQPVGLLTYFMDSNEVPVGAIYAEECYIPNHNMSTDSQSIVYQEGLSLMPERLVPVAVAAVALADTLVSTAANIAEAIGG